MRTGTFFQLISLLLDMKLSISCAYRVMCRVAPIFLYKLYEEACITVKIFLVNVRETVLVKLKQQGFQPKNNETHSEE